MLYCLQRIPDRDPPNSIHKIFQTGEELYEITFLFTYYPLYPGPRRMQEHIAGISESRLRTNRTFRRTAMPLLQSDVDLRND